MNYSYCDNGERKAALKNVKRVVVKTGSNLLRRAPQERTAELIGQLVDLRQRGYEVILVTSGAIPTGMELLGRTVRPKEFAQRQALAAIGQCRLMNFYEQACDANGFHCGQLLLTIADLTDRARNTHVAACIQAILDDGCLPIINANDSVCVDEIRIGDNDTLAAYVATILNADLTVLLTTVDGFCEMKGEKQFGERFSVVSELDERLLGMANDTDGNQFSTGGMITKLHAASICTTSGHDFAIIDGRDFSNLQRFFDGEDVGTLFVKPKQVRPMRSWQRFLAFFSTFTGDIIIDEGAAEAIVQHNRSLLPSGIIGSSGAFKAGDSVRLVDSKRRELARGIINFSYSELALICGCRTDEISARLGHPIDHPEVVHRDYLVITAAGTAGRI